MNRRAAAIALAAGVLLVAAVGCSAGSAEPSPAPTAVPATALPQVVDESAPTEPITRSDDPTLDALDVGQLFAQHVDRDGIEHGVVYPVDDGLIVHNRNGMSRPGRATAQHLGVFSALPLMGVGDATWAYDPRGDGSAYLVTSNFTVVRSARLNTLVVFDHDGLEVEFLASGQPAPGIELPAGADVLPVQRRGLLVMPRTGGTFEADGLGDSLRRIDDGRAVAASAGATVFQRCDDQLACGLVVRRVGDTVESELSLDDRQALSVSPDGSWVLHYGDGFTVAVETVTGETHELPFGDVASASWSSTGDFLAMLRPDEIELWFPSTGRLVQLPLAIPPTVDVIMVYSAQISG